MTQSPYANSQLDRVAVYQRSVPVSLERVWENVLDWEHLPWLHDSSFLDAQVIEAGDWGWRAILGIPHAKRQRHEIELELLIEESGDRYVSRTTKGQGAGSEIWTTLDAEGSKSTRVTVEFWLPDVPPERVGALGVVFTELYTKLWDEDESMMTHRQAQLDRAAPVPLEAREGVELGSLESLQARLPFDIDVDGRPFRVIELEGELFVHSTICPHRFGPLEAPPTADGQLHCPWHGYRFDPRSGASCEGRRLKLEAAPNVQIDPCTSQVRLVWL